LQTCSPNGEHSRTPVIVTAKSQESTPEISILLDHTIARPPEAAEETHQRALLLHRDYQYELAKSYNNLGEVYYETGRDD
jgi:hypothetical protein